MKNEIQNLLREYKDRCFAGHEAHEPLTQETAERILSLMEDRFLSRGEAARFMGVSLVTFDKVRATGCLPEHYPVGGKKKYARPRFRKADLVVYLENRSRGRLSVQRES